VNRSEFSDNGAVPDFGKALRSLEFQILRRTSQDRPFVHPNFPSQTEPFFEHRVSCDAATVSHDHARFND
jgi:hypothetical protein